MESNIIFQAKLSKYNSVILEGQPIWRYYAPLTDYLRNNLGKEEALLFAEPVIPDSAVRGQISAQWESIVISDKAEKIIDLPTEQQKKYFSILSEKIARLERFNTELLKSTDADAISVGKILKKALEIPDLSHVFVENDRVVLVAWGFSYVEEGEFNLKEALKNALVISPNFEEKKPEEFSDELTKNENFSTKDEVNDEKDEEEEKKEELDPSQEEDKRLSNELENEKKESNETENIEAGEVEEKGQDIQKKKWWTINWKLLLLLLLLLLIIIYCLFQKKEKPVLPDKPNVIIPIDTTKIITDTDSLKKVVSDRLNIAIMGNTSDLVKFAESFKEIYPEDKYRVIYYDTFTNRLQIQIPEQEQQEIKEVLPKKLSEFEFLIWHESVFERNIVPKDPGFSDSKKAWQYDAIRVYDAWDITRGDSNLVIAIIDDGFDLSHPELKGRLYKPWNVITQSSNVNTGLNSRHGTHVAGIALAEMNNGLGGAGIAPNCKLMPVQVGDYHGTLTTTAIIDGVLYAIHNGAKVINLSLGLKMDPKVALLPVGIQKLATNEIYKEEEKFWNQLFKIAHDRNISIVLAGGNQNILIGLDPMQRSPYTINVSAINPSNNKANFSNYGRYSTISAPGVQIYSSTPKNTYAFFDGTSMAAPIVTGGVALLRSVNPVLQTNEIVDILKATGISVNSSDGYVGNLIQLSAALNVSHNNRRQMPKVDCPDMQTKIDSLLIEIERIKELCSSDKVLDTMYIPPNTKDFGFALGRWKSTSHIYNPRTGEKVTIYFDFNQDGTGKITLVEPDDTKCSADLALTLKSNEFLIDQLDDAACYPPPDVYHNYYFECKPDDRGCAECWAQNKQNKANYFKFNLIRIRNLNF